MTGKTRITRGTGAPLVAACAGVGDRGRGQRGEQKRLRRLLVGWFWVVLTGLVGSASVAQVGAPDLTIDGITIFDSPGPWGSVVTLTVTVENSGSGVSGGTTLRYYRSTDATISTSDTEVGTDTVGSLGASDSTSEQFEPDVPSDAGTYYFGACVDTVSGESDTTNNCSGSVRIVVS